MGIVATLNFLKMLTVRAMISCKPSLMKISRWDIIWCHQDGYHTGRQDFISWRRVWHRNKGWDKVEFPWSEVCVMARKGKDESCGEREMGWGRGILCIGRPLHHPSPAVPSLSCLSFCRSLSWQALALQRTHPSRLFETLNPLIGHERRVKCLISLMLPLSKRPLHWYLGDLRLLCWTCTRGFFCLIPRSFEFGLHSACVSWASQGNLWHRVSSFGTGTELGEIKVLKKHLKMRKPRLRAATLGASGKVTISLPIASWTLLHRTGYTVLHYCLGIQC